MPVPCHLSFNSLHCVYEHLAALSKHDVVVKEQQERGENHETKRQQQQTSTGQVAGNDKSNPDL